MVSLTFLDFIGMIALPKKEQIQIFSFFVNSATYFGLTLAAGECEDYVLHS